MLVETEAELGAKSHIHNLTFGDLAFDAAHSAMTSCLATGAKIFSKEA